MRRSLGKGSAARSRDILDRATDPFPLQIPGVRLLSLQKGVPAQELAEAGAEDVGSKDWEDFADTAAVVANFDLVVSVDTAAAHLAGALGVPLWLALPSAPDWRWGWGGPTRPGIPAPGCFVRSAAATGSPSSSALPTNWRGNWQRVCFRTRAWSCQGPDGPRSPVL